MVLSHANDARYVDTYSLPVYQPPSSPPPKPQCRVCRLPHAQGDLDALLQYIDDNGDVNQRDRDNNTPLHWACQESHFDIVGVLMSRNSAVDPVNDLQSTPLHYACREVSRDSGRVSNEHA